MDRDDIMQAVEIALGDTIPGDSFTRRTARTSDIDAAAVRLRRILAELPPETSVQEILEAIDE
jgi:hypothetical protein